MFLDNSKRLFMRGLAALLPTVVTIALLVWAFDWINHNITSPITDLVIRVLPDPDEVPRFFQTFKFDPRADALEHGRPIDEFHPKTGRQLTLEYKMIANPAVNSSDPQTRARAKRQRAKAMWNIVFKKFPFNVLGFVIAIVLVWIVGYFISGLLGRTIWRIVESTLERIPVVRWFYPNIKQVTDFLFGDRQIEFTGVVAAEYPRKGIWSLGLVTGPGMRTIQDRSEEQDLVTVFIPSSPTPMTGYTITVPRGDVIELALTIDEALRFTISGGVIKPPSEGGRPEMALPEWRGGSRLLGKPSNAPSANE